MKILSHPHTYLLTIGRRQVGLGEAVKMWHDDHSALSQVHRWKVIVRDTEVAQEALGGAHEAAACVLWAGSKINDYVSFTTVKIT